MVDFGMIVESRWRSLARGCVAGSKKNNRRRIGSRQHEVSMIRAVSPFLIQAACPISFLTQPGPSFLTTSMYYVVNVDQPLNIAILVCNC